jgi:2-polyprenyl-6-hydroxyphenyl methylase/3-demethylubiquinone-9 3-methyltransferase
LTGPATRAKELAHERLGERFATALSDYDTRRRVEVLVDEFLGAERLRGRRVLDVGCGLGFFSERAAALGARVVACDLGPGLVERTRRRVRCEAVVADALDLTATFEPESFDVVISSECIEHTPQPERAVLEMVRVLRPGGTLSLSTPNLLWAPVVHAATQLGLRPFDGHENFSGWARLRRHLRRQGMVVEREEGLHLFPFQFGLHGLSRLLDRRCQWARHLMINICLRAVKGAPRDA